MCDVNGTFFFKFHSDDKSTFRGKGQHTAELHQDTDIYSMMAYTDALISDYSSIIFDYMLLERPIIHYTPDLEEFTSSSRSLNFVPTDIAVGPVCSDATELMRSLSDVANEVNESPENQARWAAIRKRFNTYVDGQSSRRTAEAINKKLLHGHLEKSRVRIGIDPATEK